MRITDRTMKIEDKLFVIIHTRNSYIVIFPDRLWKTLMISLILFVEAILLGGGGTGAPLRHLR